MKLRYLIIFGFIGMFVFIYEEKKSINNHMKNINYKPIKKAQ